MFLLSAVIGLFLSTAHAQETKPIVDNGTDPSKFLTSVQAKYEYIDLRDGFSSGALRVMYAQPFGERRDYLW